MKRYKNYKTIFPLVVFLLIATALAAQEEDVYTTNPRKGLEIYKVYQHQDSSLGTWVFKIVIPEFWHLEGGIIWTLEPDLIHELDINIYSQEEDARLDILSPQLFRWSDDAEIREALKSKGVPVLEPEKAEEFYLKLKNETLADYKNSNDKKIKITRNKTLESLLEASPMTRERIGLSLFTGQPEKASVDADVLQLDLEMKVDGISLYETVILEFYRIDLGENKTIVWGMGPAIRFISYGQKRKFNLQQFAVMFSSLKFNPMYYQRLSRAGAEIQKQHRSNAISFTELKELLQSEEAVKSDEMEAFQKYIKRAWQEKYRDWYGTGKLDKVFYYEDLEIVQIQHFWNAYFYNDSLWFAKYPSFKPRDLLGKGWRILEKSDHLKE